MENPVILIGAFHEIIELCELNKFRIVGLVDNEKQDEYFGYPIIGTDHDADAIRDLYGEIPLIATPDQPKARRRIADIYCKLGMNFIILISPKSIISKSAKIGCGTVIQHLANVSANVEIGRFVRVNTMANIMHDCVVGEYATIAPNAVILGNVKIGSGTYIGSHSTILPGISIKDNVVIGAGAVVTRDCLEPGTYVGVPAKKLR